MKIVHGIAVLEGDQNISRWIEECGRIDHDLAVRDTICPLIPIGGTVIDGGANIGTHTIPYAERVGPMGFVHAFEPYAAAAECLKFNATAFPWVSVHKCVLSDNVGYMRMQFDRSNPGGSHLAKEGVRVLSTTIDSYELPDCDLIKLDIEGGEFNALLGAANTIAKYRPILIVEVNRGHLLRATGATPDQIHSLLTGWRYQIDALAGTIGSEQYDIIAKPK